MIEVPRGAALSLRPFVIVFATESLDGRLAPPLGRRYILSCEEDFKLQHRLRASSDAVAVGADTVILDNPRLTVRRVPGRNPARVVFDGALRSPPTARVYEGPGVRILVTRPGHGEKLKPYKERGVEVIEAPTTREALEELRGRGIRRLLVEGGGGLIGTLISEGLVDEVRITIAPKILGDGVPLARIPGSIEARLVLRDFRVLCGSWVHLVYSVASPKNGVWG
jgi:2,5-diamino-6-(ribosylamino)-4(3H)-pyrimidinone 5'-phosphate reductase